MSGFGQELSGDSPQWSLHVQEGPRSWGDSGWAFTCSWLGQEVFLQEVPQGGCSRKEGDHSREGQWTWWGWSSVGTQNWNAKESLNYHTIALISHASKIMLKILQARLQQYMNRELPDVQAVEYSKRDRTYQTTLPVS